MTMPLYASAEQVMRDRSELARKGIAKGRSVVVLSYAGGVLFVAENMSTTLHKVSEIYDRIGFAAVGRYSEFENLRTAGIRWVDVRGYSYHPRDVNARALANVFAQSLGSIFTEQVKPFEVEICLAEVGASAAEDQLYRLTYDGSIFDEPQFVVMGGHAEVISTALKESYRENMELADAVQVAAAALAAGTPSTPANAKQAAPAAPAAKGGGGSGGKLEVAILDRTRPQRAFRRIVGADLEALFPAPAKEKKPKAKPDDKKPESDDTKPSGDDAKS
ncbi:proteasome subunit alpha [Allokutzneria sp. A3M-2-11 16]|uniref:proteasome subunit alpha n=1 Tax=Allokutzneria sp. A3M-2-11 16 TaxID=2962043 RepID=UPI0020B796D9|nr:proteasome subunit alpha [Allokutzneria sp. A3M-2-11 16]MCP3803708.1 proteasome subunit alpha [Allokutzneria sp. A3M-2-11 16]